jgi:hypothetical protein
MLYTLVYDKVVSRHVDPIEKKPPLPLPTRLHQLLDRYRGLQYAVCVLPELGDLPVAHRQDLQESTP